MIGYWRRRLHWYFWFRRHEGPAGAWDAARRCTSR